MSTILSALDLLRHRSVSIVAATALAVTMALSFGGAGVAADLTNHAVNTHANQLACGGVIMPPCGF